MVRVGAAQERHSVEHAFLEPFEREINHGGDVERDQLRNDQAADDDQPERPARRAIRAVTKRKRHRAHQGGQRGHDDRPKTFDARFVNGRAPIVAFVQPMKREVDNHDAVLLHDAHEEEQADDRIKRERGTENPKREQSAHDRGEERGEHRHRMDVALVENPENDIHDEQRREDEKRQSA